MMPDCKDHLYCVCELSFRSSSAAAQRLEAAAVQQGIDPARILFAPRVSPKVHHLQRAVLADVALDTLVCMYLCMHACMNAYVCVCIYIYMYIYVYIYICIHIHTYTYTYDNIFTHTLSHTHKHTRMHVHGCMHASHINQAHIFLIDAVARTHTLGLQWPHDLQRFVMVWRACRNSPW